jgi:branched-chain amino acid transport system substrate-binding protein
MKFSGRAARLAATGSVVILLGLPALLSGCGSAPARPAGPTASCATNAPGVTPTQIKVGLIYPNSGQSAIASVFQGARSGVEARVALQNDHGGINGRRIQVVWNDDQSDAATFSVVARRRVDKEKVFGLIVTSIAFGGSAGWLAQQNVPVTGPATSAVWSDYPNVFHFGSLFNGGGSSIFGQFVNAHGGTKALIVVDPNEPTSSDLAAQYDRSLASQGIHIAGTVTYDEGVTSPNQIVDQLQRSGADTLVGAAQPDGFIDIYAAAKARGVRLVVALNSSGLSRDLLARRGSQMVGMSIQSPLAYQDSPSMIAYRNAMSTYAPEVQDASDELTVGGYVAADEMLQGLRLAGRCPTRAAFIQNLRKVTDFSAGGVIAPVDLSQPKQPSLCDGFVSVSPETTFVTATPPAGLDRSGYWCGSRIN